MDVFAFGEINWLAVLVSTLVYFALGGVWYMPKLFGDAWTRSIGWDASDAESPGAIVYVAPLVTAVLVTVTLALLMGALGVAGVADGVVLGLLVGVGIVGAVMFTTAHFDPMKPQPMVWFAITAGYHLVGILLVATILAAWS